MESSKVGFMDMEKPDSGVVPVIVLFQVLLYGVQDDRRYALQSHDRHLEGRIIKRRNSKKLKDSND
jgi:hypothetical protein